MVQAVPAAPAPLVHVHTFCEHSRSLVAVSSLDSYWALLQSVCTEQVPPVVSVGAVDIHSVPVVHTFTLLHTRFCVMLGAVVSYVDPSVHVAHAVHAVPSRKNSPVQETHCGVSCWEQAPPKAGLPLVHVHTFCEHTRSVELVGAADSYWAEVHVAWAWHALALSTLE